MGPRFQARIILVVPILCLTIFMNACGSREAAEDIEPVEEIQSELVPESTSTTSPTPTDLPAEIVESFSPISPVSPIAEPTMAPNSEVTPIPGSEEALAAAIADLAEQTALQPDEIRLVSMEAVEWSDTSLGCPQEGFMYAQVITPGYLIFLEAQGQAYEYHTDRSKNVVLCES